MVATPPTSGNGKTFFAREGFFGGPGSAGVQRPNFNRRPESISALAKTTGREPGNLSRTLKTMSRYGIVDLKREKNHVRPVARATEFRIIAA